MALFERERIKDGWQPFGAPTHVISHYGDQRYAQAMVKYAEEDSAEAGAPGPDEEPE